MMNILTSYAHPVSHASLRALLAIIDSAVARADTATLAYAYDLIPPLDGDVRTNCSVYINGLIGVLEQDDAGYAQCSEEEITAARLSLDHTAYGNFDEAMHALDHDLLALDPHVAIDPASDAFRPEFFDADDRAIWDELRLVITNYQANPSGDYTLEAYMAHQRLREYQQKSYGPLLPTMVATYLRRTGKDTEGVSARLAWVDETLNVASAEPLAVLLKDHFARKHPITTHDEFVETCFPKMIGDYTLMDVSRSDMYRYEL